MGRAATARRCPHSISLCLKEGCHGIPGCRRWPPCTREQGQAHAAASKTKWKTPRSIKSQYVSASFVCRNRVAINIKGNDFRHGQRCLVSGAVFSPEP
ncbi:hypothetical protein C0Z18_32100 [Trinickia dabaoshanensis]|uniref:Uncharacterized protein n=1 Tax=Trinickia dabaoshanensis TaxID=564714 RepID=A0A2N7VB00_9BURK|nr:type II toxin-antitoxin system HigB family toxin [Trinickia dabaoshanensis]PMS14341.1 hypothetical protein C0Z18_32100 [Trinickia dabaoshanensis]